MRKHSLLIQLAVSWVLFLFVYFLLETIQLPNLSSLLSISTFLFSIFAGFFIARQGKRYSSIRDLISDFDGNTSAIHRLAHNLPKKQHDQVVSIIQKEYLRQKKQGGWDAAITGKTNFITSVHEALEGLKKKKSIHPIESAASTQIFVATRSLQSLRKRLIALKQERIPLVQWVLIDLLAAIFIVILSTLPVDGSSYAFVIKSTYATIIVLVLVMLRKFEHLDFYEKALGDDSSQDVINILKGKA